MAGSFCWRDLRGDRSQSNWSGNRKNRITGICARTRKINVPDQAGTPISPPAASTALASNITPITRAKTKATESSKRAKNRRFQSSGELDPIRPKGSSMSRPRTISIPPRTRKNQGGSNGESAQSPIADTISKSPTETANHLSHRRIVNFEVFSGVGKTTAD